MRRSCIFIGIISVQILGATEVPKKFSAAMNLGLNGPVHTQLVLVRRIGQDPRRHPQIFTSTPTPWLAFDRNGYSLEQSSDIDPQGAPREVSTSRYDADGHLLEWTQPGPESGQTWHNEYAYAPFGISETRTYRGSELVYRQTVSNGGPGGTSETVIYDSSGSVINKSICRSDSQNRSVEWTVIGPGGEITTHMQDSYDTSGDLTERVWYDPEGRLVRRMTFLDERLVYWWQDPAYVCNNKGDTGFNNSEKGITTFYDLMEDGSLQTEVQHHPGRPGNVENDDIELYDQDGNLIEKIALMYDRDAHSNWTRRILSAWDQNTDTLVPFEEDDRILTYY
jgi:hypothetical protein